MSKKEIITPDNGDKIKKAVSSYLEHASLYYNPYGYWDDYYGYDDGWCDYWAHTLKKEKKEKKKDEDELPFWDDERENKEEREIFFYSDIESTLVGGKSEASEIFHSVKELRDYCEIMGITVTHNVLNTVRNSIECHCCPYIDFDGNFTLAADVSYCGLYWTVNDYLD